MRTGRDSPPLLAWDKAFSRISPTTNTEHTPKSRASANPIQQKCWFFLANQVPAEVRLAALLTVVSSFPICPANLCAKRKDSDMSAGLHRRVRLTPRSGEISLAELYPSNREDLTSPEVLCPLE